MELDIVVSSKTETNFNSFLKMYHPYERLQVGIKVILKYGNTISDIKKREEILEEINKIDRNNETGFNKLKELRKLVAIEFPNQINFYFYYWKAYRENIKKLGKVPYKSGSLDYGNIETFEHVLQDDFDVNFQTNTQEGDENIEQVELFSYNVISDIPEVDNEVEQLREDPFSEEFFNISNRYRYSDLLNSYLKAIKECNIEKLEEIDTNNPMFKLDVSKHHKFQLPNEKEDIMKIWQYFNKHSFKQMIPNYDILIEFFSSVTDIIPPFELKISNLKEPLSGKLGTFLIHQLYRKNLNIMELLLNSFDNFNFIHQIHVLSELIDKKRFLFNGCEKLYQVDKKFSFQIIRIIKLIIDKFNKLTKDQNNIENIPTTTYSLILNHLYDQLLRVKGLTIDQLEYVRSIIPEQLFNNDYFYKTYRNFFYLNIRSPKLTKYIIERPGVTTFIQNSTQFFNDKYNTIEPITNEIVGFDLRKYLNFNLFTYDYILGRESNQYNSCNDSSSGSSSGSGSSRGSSGNDGSKNNNKKYITQFDTILKELIKQLSHDICTNVSDRDRIVKGKDFFSYSLNADLKFSLDIGRKDLFWELLDWIQQYMIKYENLMKHQVYQFNSPYESLLPTSTIFSNVKIIKKELPSPPSKELTTTTEAAIESTFLKIDNFEKPIPNESTIKVNWNSDKLIEPFKPISKLINSFNYSYGVKGLICRVMNVNEFQRFIQYNFFESFFQNEIYKYSIFMNREDLMSFLLNNYNIDADFPYFHPKYFKCQTKIVRKSLFTLAIDFIKFFLKYICKDKNITTYNQFIQNDNLEIRKQVIEKTIEILIVSLIQSIIEQSDTQLYFKSALDQVILKSKEDRKNDEINSPFIENNKNPFLQAFILGNIKTCNIILKYYPNQFKITKDSITKTLKMQNIHIIKYYYKVDNCKNLINNFKNDNNLLKHLKNELSKHPIYKYHLTWL
ncbi:hypothetical protein ACTFIW_005904 [Dictyostelium discoideum]